MATNSFDARRTLSVGGRSLDFFALDALQSRFDVARLPFSLKILLENLLRNEDGVGVRSEDVEALGFHLVGYGCTTCIGNSGPLPEEVSGVVNAEDLAIA